MAIRSAREKLGRVFFQRCFWLFMMLMVLIAVVPFVPLTPSGRLLIGGINTFLVVATVATVGRTFLSFVIVLLLAIPAVAFHYLGIVSGDPEPLAMAWGFAAALYAATVTYLLRYVFQPDVMTADKLYGAAAAYLMLGVLWAYVYSIIDYVYPNSFSIGGQSAAVAPIDTR